MIKYPWIRIEDCIASNIGMIAEFGKKQIKLNITEEVEWEDYFLQEAAKARALKARMVATDKEIDRKVYELYGLREEKVEMVEN